MKILMISSNDNKKLLGVVPFDVAEYVNAKKDNGFIPNQTKDNIKIKKLIEDIPEQLKMKA